MEEIKNSKGQPIGVQISIFDLPGLEEKEEVKKEVEVKVELDAKPVKEAVDELMAVITKHELMTSCDDEGNLVVHLGDLVTDHIIVK